MSEPTPTSTTGAPAVPALLAPKESVVAPQAPRVPVTGYEKAAWIMLAATRAVIGYVTIRFFWMVLKKR